MSGLKCQKCYRPLADCQGCNGRGGGHSGVFGSTTCSKCDGGLVCPTHGKYWK